MVPEEPAVVTIESLLDVFIGEIRAGRRPHIHSYQLAHPHLAEEIAELFPVIAAMEGWKDAETSAHGGNQSLGGVPLKQLGDFRIIREIGRGGMGIVYEAIQESLHRRVAIKVLPPLVKSTGAAIDRFQREAQLSANLHHPNIVPVFGVGCENGFHFIAMQLIEGVGLDQLLYHATVDREQSTADVEAARTKRISTLVQPSSNSVSENRSSQHSSSQSEPISENPLLAVPRTMSTTAENPTEGLDARTVARIGIQAAQAIDYAHQSGTLHRDIKPANLLLDRNNHLWVADFGLARALEHESLSRSGDIVGTLMYLAPERLHGQCDQRSDVYSLGLTLAELLRGAPVFQTASGGSIVDKIVRGIPQRSGALGAQIPPDLETVILKSIAVDPAHRYESAGAFAADLTAFLDDRPILAKPPTRVQSLKRWCRKNPLVASLTLAVSFLLIFTSILTTAGSIQQQKMRRRTEAMLDTTLGALDTMYARFALPDDSALNDTASDAIADRAVISDEAANMLVQLLAVYDELASQGGDTTKLQREAIIAKLRVAEIHLRLGNLEQAVSQYRYALTETEQLVTELADDDKQVWQQRSIRARLDLADALELLGDFAEAVTLRQTTLDILESISTKTPTTINMALIAKTHYLLGRRPNLVTSIPPAQNHKSPHSTPPPPRDAFKNENPENLPGDARDRRSIPASRPRGSDASEEELALLKARHDRRGPGPLFRQFPGRRPLPFLMIPSRLPESGISEDAVQTRVRTEHLQAGLASINTLRVPQQETPQIRHLRGLILLELAHLPTAPPETRGRLIDEVIDVHETLVKEFPNSDSYRFELAKTLSFAAQVRNEAAVMLAPKLEEHTPESVAHLEAAESFLDKAMQLTRELHQNQPEIPEYTFFLGRICESLAITSIQMAMIHGPPGPGNSKVRKAITSISEAVALQSTLVDSLGASDMDKLWLIRFKLTQLALQGVTPESSPDSDTFETIREALTTLEFNPTLSEVVDDLQAELLAIIQETQRQPRREGPGPPPHREGALPF